MAKRKDITNLDDLLGGKQGATGTGKSSVTLKDGTQRKRATRSTWPAMNQKGTARSKPTPAASSDQLVKSKPRSAATIKREYKRYGQPWAVRLPTPLINELKRIADREGLNYKALTGWALQHFAADYKAGRINLAKVKRPKGYTL